MATIYGEAVMAQHTRVEKNGTYVGGPIYYIKHIFKGKFGSFLATFFSVAIILALGFMGNMVQSNSIGSAFNTAFGVNPLIVGAVCAIIAGFIFLGGIKRIASFTEKVVPFMAILYIIGCLVILVLNSSGLVAAIQQIFVGAFAPNAIMGGALGVTVQKAMRYGVARGLFSNEAGMGSTPHAHAAAEVAHPADQGLVAMMGVFIDTFIILTMTALVILSTGVLGNGETGSVLAQSAFNAGLGTFGPVFIAFCMLFFAFTTIVGWYYFGEVNVRALFGDKAVKVYAVIVILCVAVGSTLKVDLVWNMSDMFNGLMVLPNLIALLPCIEIVKKLTKEYELKK
jgi:AGCS family alanine or glycine:cation symporter